MRTPYLEINLQKLEHNAREIVSQCREHGIQVVGVSKGVLGNEHVVNAMLRGGISWIGDSRLLNIEHMRGKGIQGPFLLMRSPHLSETSRVVAAADCSLNSEASVLKSLSEEALRAGKVHNVIIMVDMGDLREGVLPADLMDFVGEALPLRGIAIVGLGMNLTDLNGTIPTTKNNAEFLKLAREVEKAYAIQLQFLSAGNSSSQQLMAHGGIPAGINQFRIGEGILLGKETIARQDWPNTYQDAFRLVAEIIECKHKPSVPIGELGQDAFGNLPVIEDKGIQLRGILNIGRQDIQPDGLMPLDSAISILGATSDHMVIDCTKANSQLQVGSLVAFNLTYGALLAAMTSPFVEKIMIPPISKHL